MFGSIKKLFFKDTGEDLATSIPEVVATVPPTERPIVFNKPSPVIAPEIVSATSIAPSSPASVEWVMLPLKSVFARLPNSLASVVQSQGNGFVSLPSKRILEELPKGTVKIRFGELRQAAAPGTFADSLRHDQVLVELPLNEILLRLHPSLLARRSDQKQMQLPSEGSSVFGPRGEGITVSAAPMSTPKPVMAPPLKHVASGDTSISMRNIQKPTPAPIPAPNIKMTATVSAAPALRVVESKPEAVKTSETVTVSVALVCESWPEMVQFEIRELNLLNAPIVLPLHKLEPALRTGKLVFTWKQICDWMQPPVDSPSAAQDMSLELPLKIIAPLFMAKHQPAKVQKQISVSEIPDLFSGNSATITPEQPTKPAEKPALVAPAPSIPTVEKLVMAQPVPVAKIEEPPTRTETAPPIQIKLPVAPEVKPSVAGEIFNQPAKHDWPPNEVVKNLAALPGLAGAFIAMQDGLLVAAELPSHLKADTVAAFLPQIFGRMNQYTKELKLGGLSSLTFVVENITWQIVKSGSVYLVALGKPGESLPGSKLQLIAAELSKQIQ